MAAGWERGFYPKPQEDSAVQLHRYARDTMHSIVSMINPVTGLPANRIFLTNANNVIPSTDTTPTDFGLLMSDLIVARDMSILDPSTVHATIGNILQTLERMQTYNGLFYNWYNIDSGSVSEIHHSGGEVTPFISTVDNAWLAISLMVVGVALPEYSDQADTLLSKMDFPQLYDSKEELFWGGYYPRDDKYTPHHYTVLGSETRIAPYIGIAKFNIPSQSYTELYKRRKNKGRVICSWGGSMFEALLPPLFIPEKKWSEVWTTSHRAYIDRQVYFGRQHTFGYWGASPCDNPDNIYNEFGLKRLGSRKGYQQQDVLTPHATFLALPYKKRVALSNLTRMERDFEDAYRTGFGFGDSINVLTRQAASTHLAVDDSMIMLATAQASGVGVERYLEPTLEQKIRPLFEEMIPT